jgi:hypothetical protein
MAGKHFALTLSEMKLFWGDALQLHKAIEGAKLGGVGAGVNPSTALAVGLKVDVDALPPALIAALKQGKVDLSDPARTNALHASSHITPCTVRPRLVFAVPFPP